MTSSLLSGEAENVINFSRETYLICLASVCVYALMLFPNLENMVSFQNLETTLTLSFCNDCFKYRMKWVPAVQVSSGPVFVHTALHTS